MVSSAALAKRPAAALVAQAAGPKLPSYVSREQARAMINAAETTTQRLLLEALWQTGGRVQEVLRRCHHGIVCLRHQHSGSPRPRRAIHTDCNWMMTSRLGPRLTCKSGHSSD